MRAVERRGPMVEVRRRRPMVHVYPTEAREGGSRHERPPRRVEAPHDLCYLCMTGDCVQGLAGVDGQIVVHGTWPR
jgi:hypothetical protein